jgi:hypothetical protein
MNSRLSMNFLRWAVLQLRRRRRSVRYDSEEANWVQSVLPGRVDRRHVVHVPLDACAYHARDGGDCGGGCGGKIGRLSRRNCRLELTELFVVPLVSLKISSAENHVSVRLDNPSLGGVPPLAASGMLPVHSVSRAPGQFRLECSQSVSPSVPPLPPRLCPTTAILGRLSGQNVDFLGRRRIART